MHRHCGTNNRAPRWTLTDPCKPEVRPGAREESASPAWPAAPAMNARDTTKVYIWRPDTGCGPTLYRKSGCILRYLAIAENRKPHTNITCIKYTYMFGVIINCMQSFHDRLQMHVQACVLEMKHIYMLSVLFHSK